MAALRAAAAAAALLLLRTAAGLGTRPAGAQEPGGRRPVQRRSELGSGDLVAGADADDEDGFDTWYFEHAGDDTSRLSAGFDTSGPEKTEVDPEEASRVAEAWAHCHQGYLSHGSVPLENGVITYLVTRPSDLKMLEDSLQRLRYFILKHWPYDVK
ncbi:unnamed protein product, partial [Prorocentrum cordatum]